MPLDDDELLENWLAALADRHLADLRVPEVTRALRALSSAYVERRQKLQNNLDSAGKRAAFALFYAPLHFVIVRHALRKLAGGESPNELVGGPSRSEVAGRVPQSAAGRVPRRGPGDLTSIIDLGCGTGGAGAAWAIENGGGSVLGIERHPWAVGEANWTYRHFAINGRAKQGDASRLPPVRGRTGIVAGYLLNELADDARERLLRQLLEAAAGGARVLVVEPISRSLTPWWNAAVAQVVAAGGRADEWRVPADLPALVRQFDKGAGLDHRELTFKTLWLGGERLAHARA